MFFFGFLRIAALSKGTKKLIEESENLYLSIASLWEIAIKKSIHKLSIEKSITELEEICHKLQIVILPIKSKYLERLRQLPMIHGDPFDRLIISSFCKPLGALLAGIKRKPRQPFMYRLGGAFFN